jgi:glycosyltransferase involved in cell wall biosynthesis
MLAALLAAGLVFSAVAYAVGVLLLAVDRLAPAFRPGPMTSATLAVGSGAGLALPMVPDLLAALIAGTLVAATLVVCLAVLRQFRPGGAVLVGGGVALTGFGLAWGSRFLATMPVSEMTRDLLVAAAAAGVVGLPSVMVQSFESWDALARREWRRPRGRRPARTGFTPRVSIHVPAHNEPAEVVCETLDHLAALEYSNFEVVVIDNNTQDPALWRPVERHCRKLGERFRFVHKEGLTGAKAGALNYTLAQHTDPAAELIAVVDADYHVRPDFLSAVIGHFEDAAMGFVQTPHAYRDWHHSLYQRMCAWEYAFFFNTTMLSLNEHRAGLTVGTMCVIRRRALEEAGGWAEWCLTEDSELAIRIHALGYSSVYTNEVFGRGLIPETFEGYKKQRFRWTYGPVQELKTHARLFLPGRWRSPSRLSARQRIHHGNHGLDRATIGIGLIAAPFAAGALGSMIAHQEVIRVPAALWLSATVVLLAGLLGRWLVYRVAVGASLGDTIGGMVAATALSHVVSIASLFAVVGRRAQWRRTDKFRAASSGLRALAAATTELALGIALLAIAVVAFAALPREGIATMLAIGLGMQGLGYLTAPALALVADRDVRRARARDARHRRYSEIVAHAAYQHPEGPSLTAPAPAVGARA